MIHKFSFIEKMLLRLNIMPHPIIDSLSSVVAGRALQVSMKVGLIDALEKTPKSAAVLAAQTGISERGARVLLDCMAALGYVDTPSAGYRLTHRGKKFFAKESPCGLRQMLMFSDYLFSNLTELEHTVRAGGPPRTNYESFTPALWEIFTETMQEFARTNMAQVVKLIALPARAKKLLDLGGSHGLYSLELCKRHPLLEAEIMDCSLVEALATTRIAQQNMQDRVTFRRGDFLVDALGKDYDAILAFNVIHGLHAEANRHLAVKASEALNPGGRYVILDQLEDLAGHSQLSRLFTSTMGLSFFHQMGGRSYAFAEVRAWLHEAGFRSCTLKKTHAPGFALIIGEK
jgi:cyclopropane fatty-acyl-phospholipid synthase-like methyltransferase